MRKLSDLLDNICRSEADRTKAFLLINQMQAEGLLDLSIIKTKDGSIGRVEMSLSTSVVHAKSTTSH